MAENLNLKTIDTVDTRPFKKLVMTIGELPTSFVESMTYYELLAWFVNYLETVIIPTVNNNAEAVKELQDLFIELRKFVDEYFDNLDVQDEIDHKLDEMAQDGTLANIIAQYIGLGALVTFDTLTELISSHNLADGTKCKTLGKDSKGDGFGTYYTIGTTGDIPLDNGLFATLVPNFGGNNYYDEIYFNTYRANNSDYYITTIPLKDKNENQINLYIGQASSNTETPLKYAQNNFTTFTSNATLNYGGSFGVGSVISNGEIIRSVDPSLQSHNGYRYVGIKADRTFVDYQANQTTAQQMLADGCQQAWFVYFKMIENGEIIDLTNLDIGGDNIVAGKHPRQCLGVKADGTVLILTVDGRTKRNAGMTANECATILANLGCQQAWNLDGGGSSSTSIKGNKINRNVDSNGTADRWIEFTLNAKKPTIDEELAKCYSQSGNEIQHLIRTLVNTINSVSQVSYINASDLNDEKVYPTVALVHNCTNSPRASDGYFINIPHPQSNWVGLYATQFYMVRDVNVIYRRELINGEWTEWMRTDGNVFSLYNYAYDLTQTNSYELLKFNATETITPLNDTDILLTYVDKDSDDLFTKFKLNVTGTHLIKIRGRCTVKGVGDGMRYLCIRRGNSNNLRGVGINTVKTGETVTLTCDAVYNDATNANEFSLALYGVTGDRVERIYLEVEVF